MVGGSNQLKTPFLKNSIYGNKNATLKSKKTRRGSRNGGQQLPQDSHNRLFGSKVVLERSSSVTEQKPQILLELMKIMSCHFQHVAITCLLHKRANHHVMFQINSHHWQ
jgi:hypothetical protein